jgi:hypothetical protein
MKYTKPEIYGAATAVEVIKGKDKTDSLHNDNLTDQPPAFTAGAYEADE